MFSSTLQETICGPIFFGPLVLQPFLDTLVYLVKNEGGIHINLDDRVARSEISLGYVELDSLGKTLLFTRTKSDKSFL